MSRNVNKGCCKCHAGGPHEHTESNDGYDALHYIGLILCVCLSYQSLLCLYQEGVLFTTQEIWDKLHVQLHQAMNGVEKSISKMQTASGIKDKVA